MERRRFLFLLNYIRLFLRYKRTAIISTFLIYANTTKEFAYIINKHYSSISSFKVHKIGVFLSIIYGRVYRR